MVNTSLVNNLSSKITSFDVNNYRTKLSDLISGKTESPVSTISSSLYPTKTPNMSVAPVYPTPTGKAPVVTPPVITPTPSGGGSYVVKAGDSLSKIASANKMTLDQLLTLNPSFKSNPNLVTVGANIKLGGAPAPVNTPSPIAPTVTPPTVTPPVGGAPEKTPEQIASDLATEAGKAGLSTTEYQALLDRQNAVSQTESDKIKADLGIPALETAVFAKPSKSTEELFNSAFASAGLADIKTKVSALDAEITKARSDLAEATGVIDENPFLTETSRVGRGKRVLDQAETKINNLLAQKQQYNDLYTAGITEINNSILRTTNDFKTNNDMNIAQLNYLVAKADKEVSQLEKTKATASAGSIGAYLKGVTEGKAPTTIGNSESGFYKYDPTTKKFVQVIAPSALTNAQTEKAKADAQGINDFKPTADQKALVGRFANSTEGVAIGITAEDKIKLNTDPNFFYWVMQKATEAGFY